MLIHQLKEGALVKRLFFTLFLLFVASAVYSKENKIKINYGSDPSQYGYLYLPEKPAKTLVVVIHGGYWQAKHSLNYIEPACLDLQARDYAVWSIEYRRVGQGGGWQTTSEDVLAAINHLEKIAKDYPIPTQNIILLGHSVGAQLAWWAASRADQPSATFAKLQPKVAGVISLAGVSDLLLLDKGHRSANKDYVPITNFLGANPADIPETVKQVSPIELLPLGVKQILLHGDMDINVPIGVSTLYKNKAAITGDHVKFITLPLADHFTIVNPTTSFWKQVVTAVGELEN
ncbi:alpha/beta hydrolase [Neisseriaceae bacterium TC5R-5]|nr:alpha/beta hydrolase [Neisseriaceae bacterium TC5R-5]